jgi:hypothetical protein
MLLSIYPTLAKQLGIDPADFWSENPYNAENILYLLNLNLIGFIGFMLFSYLNGMKMG